MNGILLFNLVGLRQREQGAEQGGGARHDLICFNDLIRRDEKRRGEPEPEEECGNLAG